MGRCEIQERWSGLWVPLHCNSVGPVLDAQHEFGIFVSMCGRQGGGMCAEMLSGLRMELRVQSEA